MPAVGLALLLVVMLKKENAAYLLAGFVIMVITNCQNILPIAVIAGCIAYVNFTRDTETAKLTAASAATAPRKEILKMASNKITKKRPQRNGRPFYGGAVLLQL